MLAHSFQIQQQRQQKQILKPLVLCARTVVKKRIRFWLQGVHSLLERDINQYTVVNSTGCPNSTGSANMKTCPVLVAGAWEDWAEEVPSELGLEDGQSLHGREEQEEHFR